MMPSRFASLKRYRPKSEKLADDLEKVKSKPKAPRGASIQTLDRAFSKKVRERDCPGGIGVCVTCKRLKPYAEMDCGHYLGRQYFATRWNEMNCAAQCRYCNRFNEGLKDKFRAALIEKHGEEAILKMEALHKTGKKPRPHEAVEILKQIRGK